MYFIEYACFDIHPHQPSVPSLMLNQKNVVILNEVKDLLFNRILDEVNYGFFALSCAVAFALTVKLSLASTSRFAASGSITFHITP